MTTIEQNAMPAARPLRKTGSNEAASAGRRQYEVVEALRRHWPEYLMEGALLGGFMVSACVFGALYEFSGSPVRMAIASAFLRRMLMGITMGLTAVVLIYSPWGKQSGAHINPAVTLSFLRLGKIKLTDALFYMTSQFAGATLGVTLVVALLPREMADPAVRYVVTVPGSAGVGGALIGELCISAAMFSAILVASNHSRLSTYTGVVAGVLLATFITLEAPFSGTSLNPARTFGSALPPGIWDSFWIYVIGPVGGMLLAAETYLRAAGRHRAGCPKLHHVNCKRCIFCGANGGFAS
jgi:aquaporin Z